MDDGRLGFRRRSGRDYDGKRKAATDQLPGIRENPYRGIRLRVYNNRTVSSGHIATMATSHNCEVLKPVMSVCNAGRVQLFVADIGTTPLYRLKQRLVLRLFCGEYAHSMTSRRSSSPIWCAMPGYSRSELPSIQE